MKLELSPLNEDIYIKSSSSKDVHILYAIHDLVYIADKLKSINHGEIAGDIEAVINTLR